MYIYTHNIVMKNIYTNNLDIIKYYSIRNIYTNNRVIVNLSSSSTTQPGLDSTVAVRLDTSWFACPTPRPIETRTIDPRPTRMRRSHRPSYANAVLLLLLRFTTEYIKMPVQNINSTHNFRNCSRNSNRVPHNTTWSEIERFVQTINSCLQNSRFKLKYQIYYFTDPEHLCLETAPWLLQTKYYISI